MKPLKTLGIVLLPVAILFGFCALVGVGWIVAIATGSSWVYWSFPSENTPQGKIARAAWEEPLSPTWSIPPVDISEKACPVVDASLRADIEARADRNWTLSLGVGCLTAQRTVAVTLNAATGACHATVDIPTPSCSF